MTSYHVTADKMAVVDVGVVCFVGVAFFAKYPLHGLPPTAELNKMAPILLVIPTSCSSYQRRRYHSLSTISDVSPFRHAGIFNIDQQSYIPLLETCLTKNLRNTNIRKLIFTATFLKRYNS